MRKHRNEDDELPGDELCDESSARSGWRVPSDLGLCGCLEPDRLLLFEFNENRNGSRFGRLAHVGNLPRNEYGSVLFVVWRRDQYDDSGEFDFGQR